MCELRWAYVARACNHNWVCHQASVKTAPNLERMCVKIALWASSGGRASISSGSTSLRPNARSHEASQGPLRAVVGPSSCMTLPRTVMASTGWIGQFRVHCHPSRGCQCCCSVNLSTSGAAGKWRPLRILRHICSTIDLPTWARRGYRSKHMHVWKC